MTQRLKLITESLWQGGFQTLSYKAVERESSLDNAALALPDKLCQGDIISFVRKPAQCVYEYANSGR